MQRKQILLAAAMAGALTLGVIVGPTLGSMAVNAQTQAPTPTQPPAQSQSAPAGQLANAFLDKLAAALQIQRSALDSAMTSAATGTADTAVQQGTLTQAQADALKARIAAGDLGALWGSHGWAGGKAGGGGQLGGVKPAMLDAAAKTLNITTPELLTQLRSGQTLAQLAQAHGTTEQAVTSTALAAAKTQLDQAVTKGTLTQAQADVIYARLQQQGVNLLGRSGFGGAQGQPQGGAQGGVQRGGPQGQVRQALVAGAAKALNTTTTELLTQLRSGQTLAQLAQAHGTTEQAVTSAALAAAKTQLDQAVANGTLTQAQADASYARLQQQGANLLMPRGFGGRGRQGAPMPQVPTT